MLMTAGKAQSGSRMAISSVTTLPAVMAWKTPLADWKVSVVPHLWRTDRRAARPDVSKIVMMSWGLVLLLAVEGCPSGTLRDCPPVTTLPVIRFRRAPLVGWKMRVKMACCGWRGRRRAWLVSRSGMQNWGLVLLVAAEGIP